MTHDDGQVAWVDKLGLNTALERLELRNNDLTDDSAVRLIRMLSGDPTRGEKPGVQVKEVSGMEGGISERGRTGRDP